MNYSYNSQVRLKKTRKKYSGTKASKESKKKDETDKENIEKVNKYIKIVTSYLMLYL